MSEKEFVKWSRKSDLAQDVFELAMRCKEYDKATRALNKLKAINDYIGDGINWGG